MVQNEKIQAQPETAHAQPVEPVVLPDVAIPGHLSAPTEPNSVDNSSEAGEKKLQDVLPEINEVAKKVGGYKKLSDIADTLDGMGK
jgi:hypothetical protein